MSQQPGTPKKGNRRQGRRKKRQRQKSRGRAQLIAFEAFVEDLIGQWQSYREQHDDGTPFAYDAGLGAAARGSANPASAAGPHACGICDEDCADLAALNAHQTRAHMGDGQGTMDIVISEFSLDSAPRCSVGCHRLRPVAPGDGVVPG